MNVKKRAKGTVDEPTLIPSMFDKRLVGCICKYCIMMSPSNDVVDSLGHLRFAKQYSNEKVFLVRRVAKKKARWEVGNPPPPPLFHVCIN